MAETIVSAELDEEVVPSSYTSETESAPAGAGQSITAPGAGLGRRKEAVARVRLVPGSGKWTINGRTLEDYFPNKLHQQLVKSPFVLLDIDGRFDVIARINGGGISGQAGALRLGVSRALNEIDRDANRPALKKAGFLTRDARAIERKKAGRTTARTASPFRKRGSPSAHFLLVAPRSRGARPFCSCQHRPQCERRRCPGHGLVQGRGRSRGTLRPVV